MIRPAKCHFDGFIKAFIKGADKNHNPRKGTETNPESEEFSIRTDMIRTIIPARGRKLCLVKVIRGKIGDKNHNPRKGTETFSFQPFGLNKYILIRTIIPARGRKRKVHKI